MKQKNENEKKNHGTDHSHLKHMKMMAICCGLPIVGFLLIGLLGIRSPSLETMLGFKRAGADLILTYHALDVARWLGNNEGS